MSPGAGYKHYVDTGHNSAEGDNPSHTQSVNPFFAAIQSKYLEADAIQKTFNTDHSWTDVNTEDVDTNERVRELCFVLPE